MPIKINKNNNLKKFPNVPHHSPSLIRKLTHSPKFAPPTHSPFERRMVNNLRGTPPTEILRQYEKYLQELDNGAKKSPSIERVLMTAFKENTADVFNNNPLAFFRMQYENIKNPFEKRIKIKLKSIQSYQASNKLLPKEKQEKIKNKVEIFKLLALNEVLKKNTFLHYKPQ